MAKYRKKPVVVEAVRWFQNGDHPKDDLSMFVHDGLQFPTEGKVVR